MCSLAPPGIDTRSAEQVDAAFAEHGPTLTAVAHLAGQVAMTTDSERPRYDFEVNTLGALNVLKALRATNKRIPLK